MLHHVRRCDFMVRYGRHRRVVAGALRQCRTAATQRERHSHDRCGRYRPRGHFQSPCEISLSGEPMELFPRPGSPGTTLILSANTGNRIKAGKGILLAFPHALELWHRSVLCVAIGAAEGLCLHVVPMHLSDGGAWGRRGSFA